MTAHRYMHGTVLYTLRRRMNIYTKKNSARGIHARTQAGWHQQTHRGDSFITSLSSRGEACASTWSSRCRLLHRCRRPLHCRRRPLHRRRRPLHRRRRPLHRHRRPLHRRRRYHQLVRVLQRLSIPCPEARDLSAVKCESVKVSYTRCSPFSDAPLSDAGRFR